MTAGLQSSTNNTTFTISLVEAATANNSPPSGATAGIATLTLAEGLGYRPAVASLAVVSTAGSGTMTVTVRMWGYITSLAKWIPIGPGGDTTKGTVNGGSAIGETSANAITHVEEFRNPFHFDRLYAEILAIGGTSTAITVALIAPRYGAP
ncbi:MAG: hypothetical protein IPJ61_20800 [Tessaracoccus sp.]|uniref:hypothetical protein n=1 Tax=Tessaracoccus sp. TaxID=1971211 RepID=UPI001EB37E52|nr:hypothetical protein [Tessaracoccus sp.]MBK7823429.1 hypothetical protein [Tessaracoccus sp.]